MLEQVQEAEPFGACRRGYDLSIWPIVPRRTLERLRFIELRPKEAGVSNLSVKKLQASLC